MTDKVAMEVFVSPNESDRNMEPANIVDALFEIARALHRLADIADAQGGNADLAHSIKYGLAGVAESIRARGEPE